MSAVSPLLIETIKELQSLPSLSNFALAGGTNLAVRYNHRKSIDIDLFCSDIVGIDGFERIVNEIQEYYGKSVFSLDYPCKINDQYIFLRFFIQKTKNDIIKIELLQNMKMLYDVEVIDDMRLVAKKDIGLFKLISASSRAGKKDIYDLDYITEEISLIDLFNKLKEKKNQFNKEEDKTIFDLDGEECPAQNPKLLLSFDGVLKTNTTKPIHTNDTIDITEGSKTWIMSRITWKQKVRELFRYLGIEYPSVQGRSI